MQAQSNWNITIYNVNIHDQVKSIMSAYASLTTEYHMGEWCVYHDKNVWL